jgi:hypothetical protein
VNAAVAQGMGHGGGWNVIYAKAKDLPRGKRMTPEQEQAEIERVVEVMKWANACFVFGANRAGRHGAGAANAALKYYGAVYGQGEGLQGRSYAVPTLDENLEQLTLAELEGHIKTFLVFALMNPNTTFALTRIGCGLAGFTDDQLIEILSNYNIPTNIEMPPGWRTR